MQLGPKAEDVQKPVNPFVFALRFILGAIAATYFVLVPIYMWLKDQIVPKGQPIWNIEIFWVAAADNKADSCAFPFLFLNMTTSFFLEQVRWHISPVQLDGFCGGIFLILSALICDSKYNTIASVNFNNLYLTGSVQTMIQISFFWCSGWNIYRFCATFIW